MLTPVKAIRAKCLQCTCNQTVEVRECTVTDCAIYQYRMGHRPKKDKYIEYEPDNEENLT